MLMFNYPNTDKACYSMNYDWIGKRIKQIRKARGLTGLDIAGAVGVGQSTISQIENHRQLPNIETLDAICSALSVTLGEFFSDELSGLPEDTQRLIHATNRLTPSQREALERFLDTLDGR